MTDLKVPVITISIVNLDGKHYLDSCLTSISGLDYPAEKIEVIMVDNGSSDGSVEFIEKKFPDVKVIRNKSNNGFAPANNQAAREAAGKYIAFLNNDTRVDKNWLKTLIRPIYKDRITVCSGSKVLSEDGKKIDFVGGMVNFEGKGFQVDYGVDIGDDTHHMHRFSPFVNGGSMLIDREVFLDIGGFDEDFFAYYEDVDLGWRLWVLGYKVVFCPDSIVYHAHHGTSKRFSEERLRFLKERNSLIMMYKNYEDKNLARMASLSQLGLYGRVFVDFDPGEGNTEIKRWPASSIAAYRDFRKNIEKHRAKRDFIQENRKRQDQNVFTYFKGWYLSSSSAPSYQALQTDLLEGFGAAEVFKKQIDKTMLMIVSGSSDELICRYLSIARVLSEYMEVIVAIPEGIEVFTELEITRYTKDNIRSIVDGSDIIYTDHDVLYQNPFIKDSEQFIILDCFQVGISFNSSQDLLALNESFYYGDLFICEGTKQRDFLIGMLSALDRINPYIFIEDPTLEKLVCDISQAIPPNEPLVLTDVFSNIKDLSLKDFIVLDLAPSNGKASEDDHLLIDAISTASRDKKDLKALFLGFSDESLKDYSKKLNLLGKKVFFIDEVKKGCDIADYIGPADLCFAGRDKTINDIISILWADISVLAIEDSPVSALVEDEGLGKACSVFRVQDMLSMLSGDKGILEEYKNKISAYKEKKTWEKATKPILDFCINPVARAKRDRGGSKHQDIRPGRNTADMGYLGKFFYHLRKSGLRKTLKYSANLVRKR